MENDPNKIDFNRIKTLQEIQNKNNFAGTAPNPSFSDYGQNINGGQNLVHLPGAVSLLIEAWNIFIERYKTFVGVYIVSSLLGISIIAIPGIFYAIVVILSGNSSSDSQLLISILNITNFILGLWAIFIFPIAIILTLIWNQTALIYAIMGRGENAGVMEYCKRGWHKIRSFFWISLLSALIILGGSMLFVIPGIIFYVWFSFSVFILIMEDFKGMNAILKSREYVRGYWFNVFWRLLFMGFIILVVRVGMVLIEQTLKDSPIAAVLTLLEIVFSLIMTPIILIYSFLIYENLKKIKGSFEFIPSSKTKRSYILVSVLGLIAMLVIPAAFIYMIVSSSLNNARDRAADAKIKMDQMQMRSSLEIYYSDNSKYPQDLSEIDLGYLSSEADKFDYKQLDEGNDFELCITTRTEEKECIYSFNHMDLDAGKVEKKADYKIEKQSDSNDLINTPDAITGRDLKRKSDLGEIMLMVYNYKSMYGNFPISPIASKLNEENEVAIGIGVAGGENLPLDPKDPEYYYAYKSIDGQNFELSARLEDLNDSGCENIKNICLYVNRY